MSCGSSNRRPTVFAGGEMRKDGVRLLIVDEEIIVGGVETLRLNPIPELARLCESLVWALPKPHDQIFRERMRSVPNLVVESLSWPRGSVGHIFGALLRGCRAHFLLLV